MKLTKSDKRVLDRVFPRPEYDQPIVASFSSKDVTIQPHDVGVIRRVRLDDPAELVRGFLLSIREQWAIFAWKREKNRWYDTMWHVFILSAAIHDWELFEKIREEFPDRAKGNHEVWDLLIYEKLLGIVRGTYPIPGHDEIKVPKDAGKTTFSLLDCIDAIGTRDPGWFTESLAEDLKIQRKSIGLDPCDRMVSMTAHGLWEIANLTDPALVKDWDVEQALPWDAGLHEFVRNLENPLELIPSDASEILRKRVELPDMRAE